MAAVKGVIPWWSVAVNWIIGKQSEAVFPLRILGEVINTVTFGNLAGSLFFAAVLVKCESLDYKAFNRD